MSDDRAAWRQQNQAWLVLAIEGLRGRLRQAAFGDAVTEPADLIADLAALREAMSAPPALESLAAAFVLTPFETALLLLCAAHELSGDIAALCAAAGGGAYPSLGLALAVLPEPAWTGLAASGKLRRWRLVHRADDGGLTAARLTIDERVLDFLLGLDVVDQRLGAAVLPDPGDAPLFAVEEAAGVEAAAALGSTGRSNPVVQLVGGRPAVRLAVAGDAARRIGARLLPLSAASLLAGDAERDLRLAEREYRLDGRLPMIDTADVSPADEARLDRLLHGMETPVLVGSDSPRRLDHVASTLVAIASPSIVERIGLWHRLVGDGETETVARLAVQFPLSARDVAVNADRWRREGSDDPARLWAVCRDGARPALEALATRIIPCATWDQLVLPAATLAPIRDLVAQAQGRARLYADWGFAARNGGLGLAALFAGSSGTGKTMAAEVIANALSLDLFRVDLSRIVSKYIGETEKQLRALFDAAEDGGAILLFDEADALFGRRSEVKDSHDRYGNIEVSYLLQRLETYSGIVILTTNMKSSIDEAFLRRLRFIIDFGFPEEADRARLWASLFPADAPTDGLDHQRLARLAVGGGVARNIALTAAFAAAEQDAPIGMGHLAQAARREYRKLGRTPSRAELEGWEDA